MQDTITEWEGGQETDTVSLLTLATALTHRQNPETRLTASSMYVSHGYLSYASELIISILELRILPIHDKITCLVCVFLGFFRLCKSKM